MRLILLPTLACLLATDLSAQQAAAKRGLSDNMWVAAEVPSPLPEGVSHHTFTSEALGGREVGYSIYLPPDYEQRAQKRFPVIYNLHGANGDEVRTLYNATVLHRGIQQGRWPSAIMVFPNGGRTTMYQNSADGRYPAETIFIEELIPHIDATYRTIADRSGRCIEGFSMGGRGSTYLALRHPHLFCSLFNQAGNVYSPTEKLATTEADEWPRVYLGEDPDYLKAHDVFEILRGQAKTIRESLRIQIICGTRDGGHLPSVREFHQALVDARIDHTYLEIEGIGHRQRDLIELLEPVWFDYHFESLRLSGALK